MFIAIITNIISEVNQFARHARLGQRTTMLMWYYGLQQDSGQVERLVS